MKIEELDFTVRTYNCLKRARIDTVEQLKMLSDTDLSQIRNLGQKCAEEICQKVGRVPPTNAERIRAMSDEELADFLCSIAYTGNTPWSEPFARKFCDNCPDPEYTLDDGRKMNLHECDFVDGKCPHRSDCVWWLQQSAKGMI